MCVVQRMCRFVVEAESGDVVAMPEYEKGGSQVIRGNEFCRVAWKATNLPEEDLDVEILYLFWGIIRQDKVCVCACVCVCVCVCVQTFVYPSFVCGSLPLCVSVCFVRSREFGAMCSAYLFCAHRPISSPLRATRRPFLYT